MQQKKTKIPRKPEWLKIKLPDVQARNKMNGLVGPAGLNTICESGNCPNSGDCWSRGTATFMILGDICTRSCKFCNVKTGRPGPLNTNEPINIAESVKQLALKHCVITSVDRDDLIDGGADHWVNTIRSIKKLNPETTIEVLIPDFSGEEKQLRKIIDVAPNVISHNLETVERLTPLIRSKAKYRISLKVLEQIATSQLVSKSGIMLGLGETREEILQTMDDLREIDCKVLTLGQYLQPTKKHFPVLEYLHPDFFNELKQIGLQKGFFHVESSPLVRSSYRAEKHIKI